MSGFDATVHLIYVAAAAGFVVGLHLMNSPATARRGNQLSAGGMTVAIATTVVVLLHENRITSTGWIVLVAGGGRDRRLGGRPTRRRTYLRGAAGVRRVRLPRHGVLAGRRVAGRFPLR